LQMGT